MQNKVAKLIEIEWEKLRWLQGELKQISKENIEKIKNSFRENGFVQPFFVWKDDSGEYWILDGHHRIKVLRELKEEGADVPEKLPAIEIEAESRDAAAKLVLIYSSSYAEITKDGLEKFAKDFDLDLESLNKETDLIGIDLDSLIIDLRHGQLTEEQLDDAPSVQEKTFSQTGDIFLLDNRHRVMCGDSTKKEDVEKLMDGKKADIFYSDPPYNIGLDYRNGMRNTQDKYTKSKIFNDEKSEIEYKEFISNALRIAKLFMKEDAHYFYWCDEKYIYLFQEIFAENNIKNERVNIWIKNTFNVIPQIAFNKIYEPCIYGITGKPYLNKELTNFSEILNSELTGKQIINKILNYLNIWIEKRDRTDKYAHPTQKPVQLHYKPIKRCSTIMDIILDLFLGSGSTLIAAEQTGRVCYGMEIDPHFIDVILRRYKKLYPDAEIKCLNREFDFGKLFEGLNG